MAAPVAVAVAALLLGIPAARAADPDTAFTYQGVLTSNGVPVNSTVTATFRLFDAESGGSQIGTDIVRSVTPDAGVFTETLDFGVDPWTPNQARWLDIRVNADQLGRHRMQGAPYALNTRGVVVDELGRVGVGAASTFWPLTVNSIGDGFVQHADIDGISVGSYAGGNIGWYGTYSNHPLGFFVAYGANAALLIDQAENVGIGTMAPTDRLHVSGGDVRIDSFQRLNFGAYTGSDATSENADGIYFSRFNGGPDITNLYLHLGDDSGPCCDATDAFIIQVGGDDVFDFFSDGTAAKPGGGSWTALSDVRAKRDITPLDKPLDKLLRLRGVSFHYKDPTAAGAAPGLRTGMIAQEVEQVFPEWISTGRDGMKTLTYSGFEALTVEAVRQLRAEKDAQIESLIAEVDRLNARMAAFEAAFAASR
jgi:hypothetical protein